MRRTKRRKTSSISRQQFSMAITINYAQGTYALVGFRRCNDGSAVSLVGSRASLEVRQGDAVTSTLVHAYDDGAEGGIYMGGDFGEASGVIWWWIEPGQISGFAVNDTLYFTLLLRDSLGTIIAPIESGYIRIVQQVVEDVPGSAPAGPEYPASLPTIPTDFTGIQLIVSDDLIASIAHVAGPAGAQGEVGPTVVPPLNLRLVYPDDDGYAMTIFPDPDVDTESAPFYVSGLSFDNPDLSKNFVVRWGHNLDPGGGLVDPTRPASGIEFEQSYNYFGTMACETHLIFRSTANGLNRWLTALFPITAAPTTGNSQAIFRIQYLSHQAFDGTQYWISNATAFTMLDRPFATDFSSTTANHLVLGGPAGMTSGKFVSIRKNSTEFFAINAYGETTIDGSSSAVSGGNSGALAFFDLIGHKGNEFVFNARDYNATSRFSVSGDGTYAVFASNDLYLRGNTTIQNGKNFGIQNGGGSLVFYVGGDGAIWTNQYAAGALTGSQIGKIEVRQAPGGAVLGYIPIWDS